MPKIGGWIRAEKRYEYAVDDRCADTAEEKPRKMKEDEVGGLLARLQFGVDSQEYKPVG